MTPEEEHYQGGYVDGIEDSLVTILRAETLENAARAIAASTEKTKSLASRYGVNRTTIQRIRRGAAWTALKARGME